MFASPLLFRQSPGALSQQTASSMLSFVVRHRSRQVLQTTQQIERDLGKSQRHATIRNKTTRYHDRPIDIDILLYDDLIIDEPDLKIPHPLMQQRDFVMKPLNEITAAD